jgi:teichuronic acid biosynthesis glycosyltransferase TuaG
MSPELAPISVIIPAFRAAKTMRRALESVAAQTLKPFEVVVVDDGSDDGTFEAAKACQKMLEPTKLKLFRQENQGAGAARNKAVLEASSDILAFLDADDEWLAEKLERSLSVMRGGNHVLVAHNGLIAEEGRETLNDCAKRFYQGNDPFVSLYRKGFIDTCTVLSERRAIVEAGGFDTSLKNAQDFEMWLAVLAPTNRTFVVFEDVLSRYHIVQGSIMSHTARRLRCCMDIAHRYANALKGRTPSPLKDVLYRVLAIHYESVTAYRNQGRYWAVLGVLSGLPCRLAGAALALLDGTQKERRDFLSVSPNDAALSEDKPLPRVFVVLLWLWLAAILGAYLAQFRHLFEPILRAIGLI